MQFANQHPVWYACEEHIDLVIDEIVDRYSLPPVMERISPDTATEKQGCSWCGGVPRYQLEIDCADES
ncbi:CxxH/CxxC protein [Lihuaxuella thermophila]|uniref:CxxH/CxxC protein, BA_5709 family n=1 Tax=Lihuaxuella thermophila TaxID=1173111 RepID=A0A1H8BH47_9BACL|nr:CxxH/CxxC protein [Lihuaxuella thermophila]SEM82280.1 CxxH/CxxC protein, BA_5709 family [Lihuaxuella thermophila]